MAYNYYNPSYYNPTPMPIMAPQQPTPQMPAPTSAPTSANNGIIWVQGESAAKSYPVAAGQSILLMDSEDSLMYIKSTDQSGMPQPLRVFEYTERKTEHSEAGAAKTSNESYISRKEFEEFKEDVKRSIRGIRKTKIETEEE